MRFLLASLLLNGIFLLSMLGAMRFAPLKQQDAPVLMVDLKTQPLGDPNMPHGQKGVLGGAVTGGHSQGASTQLKKYFRLSPVGDTMGLGIEKSGTGYLGHGSDGASKLGAWGRRDNAELVAQIPDTPIYKRFFRTMNEALIYPDAFGKAGIEGEVQMELRFSVAVPTDSKIVSLKAENPYLRVAVMRAWRRVMQLDWPNSEDKRKLDISARFHFVAEDTDYTKPQELDFGFGRDLKFYREYAYSRMDNSIRAGHVKFTGDPLLDLQALQANSVEDARIDPLEEYRLDPEFSGS